VDTCDVCKGPHSTDACKQKTTEVGCCLKYHECYWCDALFCQHGYLSTIPSNITVIPWFKLCPRCQEESNDG
jgi:hypothetical protein